jgi:transcriptional regulator with XRE-family HTH domain
MPELTELTDAEICALIGERLKTERLRLNLAQAEVSHQAGISLRTYRRFEATGISTLPTFVAVLRVLKRLRMLEVSLPAPILGHRESLISKVERLRQRARMPSPSSRRSTGQPR